MHPWPKRATRLTSAWTLKAWETLYFICHLLEGLVGRPSYTDRTQRRPVHLGSSGCMLTWLDVLGLRSKPRAGSQVMGISPTTPHPLWQFLHSTLGRLLTGRCHWLLVCCVDTSLPGDHLLSWQDSSWCRWDGLKGFLLLCSRQISWLAVGG